VAPVLQSKPSPPYFKPKLQNQKVDQCSEVNAKLWSFTLPDRVDPSDKAIKVEVSYDKTFFEYDNERLSFTQQKLVSESTLQTINVTLSDELDAKATYTMQV
jgi:hypothetical protein